MSKCTWIYSKEQNNKSQSLLSLRLNNFLTECGWDYLYIHDGDSIYSPLIGAFSGSLSPNLLQYYSDFKATTENFFIHFFSDESYVQSGFNLTYSKINNCDHLSNCSNHGTCLETKCVCDKDWLGQSCQLPFNILTKHPECSMFFSNTTTPKILDQNKSYFIDPNYSWIVNVRDGPAISGHDLIYNAVTWEIYAFFGYNFKAQNLYITSVFGKDSRSSTEISVQFNLFRFDIKTFSWRQHFFPSNNSSQPCYDVSIGHTTVLFKNFVLIFGGHDITGNFTWFESPTPLTESQQPSLTFGLQVLDMSSLSWICNRLAYLNFITGLTTTPTSTFIQDAAGNSETPISVTGHTAHVLDFHIKEQQPLMIIMFGYNPSYGFIPYVQEFNLGNASWIILGDDPNEFTGAVLTGRAFHTSSMDTETNLIYVLGGITASFKNTLTEPSATLFTYDPFKRRWMVLESSPYRIHMHTSTLYNGLLLVFGGQTQFARNFSRYSCYSSHFLAYDIANNEWNELPTPSSRFFNQRIGHSSVLINNSWYIHGGFNGLILSDTLILNFTDPYTLCTRMIHAFLANFRSKLALKPHISITPLSNDSWNNLKLTFKKFITNLPDNFSSDFIVENVSSEDTAKFVKTLMPVCLLNRFFTRQNTTLLTEIERIGLLEEYCRESNLVRLLKRPTRNNVIAKFSGDAMNFNSTLSLGELKLHGFIRKPSSLVETSRLTNHFLRAGNVIGPGNFNLNNEGYSHINNNYLQLDDYKQLNKSTSSSEKSRLMPDYYEKFLSAALSSVPLMTTRYNKHFDNVKRDDGDAFDEVNNHVNRQIIQSNMVASAPTASLIELPEANDNINYHSFLADNSVSHNDLNDDLDKLIPKTNHPTVQKTNDAAGALFVDTRCMDNEDCTTCLSTKWNCVWCPNNNIGCISFKYLESSFSYTITHEGNKIEHIIQCPITVAPRLSSPPSKKKSTNNNNKAKRVDEKENFDHSMDENSYRRDTNVLRGGMNNIVEEGDDDVDVSTNRQRQGGFKIQEKILFFRTSLTHDPSNLLFDRAKTNHVVTKYYNDVTRKSHDLKDNNNNNNAHQQGYENLSLKPIMRPDKCPVWSKRICEIYSNCYSCHRNPVCAWVFHVRYQCITLFMIKDSVISIYNPLDKITGPITTEATTAPPKFNLTIDSKIFTKATIITSTINNKYSTDYSSSIPSVTLSPLNLDTKDERLLLTNTAGRFTAPNRYCPKPCDAYEDCLNCTRHGCLWCSTYGKCIDGAVYTIIYPFGQCFIWYSKISRCPTYEAFIKARDSALLAYAYKPYLEKVKVKVLKDFIDNMRALVNLNALFINDGPNGGNQSYRPDVGHITDGQNIDFDDPNDVEEKELQRMSTLSPGLNESRGSIKTPPSSFLNSTLKTLTRFHEICGQYKSCDDCQSDPGCGWCDDISNTGKGSCIPGGYNNPMPFKIPEGMSQTQIDSLRCSSSSLWYFTGCPICQCNGHSVCSSSRNLQDSFTDKSLPAPPITNLDSHSSNLSDPGLGVRVCVKCNNHTIGLHCEKCASGYFGDARNGGICVPCQCNGHATRCDPETGSCYCTTKGIIGHNCQLCDTASQYTGDPLNGGTCYYILTTDYLFTFNLTKPEDHHLTFLNLINHLSKPDNAIELKIACLGHPKVNVSYVKEGSSIHIELVANYVCHKQFTMEIDSKFFTAPIPPHQSASPRLAFPPDDRRYRRKLYTKQEVDDYYNQDSRKSFKSKVSRSLTTKTAAISSSPSVKNGYGNVTFFLYFYDFEAPVLIYISFSHTPKLDILQFFITFLSCFIFLLFFAAVIWKIKQKYNLYRRRQRLFIEMEQMATRPFTSMYLYLESRLPSFYVRKKRRNRPTPIAIEPLIDETSAILTVVVRLPTDKDKNGYPITPYGASGIALGSTLVSMGNLNLLPKNRIAATTTNTNNLIADENIRKYYSNYDRLRRSQDRRTGVGGRRRRRHVGLSEERPLHRTMTAIGRRLNRNANTNSSSPRRFSVLRNDIESYLRYLNPFRRHRVFGLNNYAARETRPHGVSSSVAALRNRQPPTPAISTSNFRSPSPPHHSNTSIVPNFVDSNSWQRWWKCMLLNNNYNKRNNNINIHMDDTNPSITSAKISNNLIPPTTSTTPPEESPQTTLTSGGGRRRIRVKGYDQVLRKFLHDQTRATKEQRGNEMVPPGGGGDSAVSTLNSSSPTMRALTLIGQSIDTTVADITNSNTTAVAMEGQLDDVEESWNKILIPESSQTSTSTYKAHQSDVIL